MSFHQPQIMEIQLKNGKIHLMETKIQPRIGEKNVSLPSDGTSGKRKSYFAKQWKHDFHHAS